MPTKINYHHYSKDPERLTSEFGDNWMYCGRENRGLGLARSPLANPFVADARANGKLSKDPIASYRHWLWHKVVMGDTAVMKALAAINEETALVCWCAPNPCHVDVIIDCWHYLSYGQFAKPSETIPTKALSIRQPWAWLITRPDVMEPRERGSLFLNDVLKSVENRTWEMPKAMKGEEIFIHTGDKIDHLGIEYVVSNFPGVLLPNEYETGGIVGRAKLVDCVQNHGSRWAVRGQKQFVLMGVRPLPFVECRGQLKFFSVSEVME